MLADSNIFIFNNKQRFIFKRVVGCVMSHSLAEARASMSKAMMDPLNNIFFLDGKAERG